MNLTDATDAELKRYAHPALTVGRTNQLQAIAAEVTP